MNEISNYIDRELVNLANKADFAGLRNVASEIDATRKKVRMFIRPQDMDRLSDEVLLDMFTATIRERANDTATEAMRLEILGRMAEQAARE